MEKFKTGGLRRHEIIYALDTGRLMGDPFGYLVIEYFLSPLLQYGNESLRER